ncbi:YcjF family protein [Stappia indica]|uniref:Putative membrane protein n=1 Tax=Stappia indica TaxID=538381 RepID=A0A285R508_9HYPH|nr:TIGR01620 family protein [Stappia indica]SOB89193.1 putative membrane protein [Stappia indica]
MTSSDDRSRRERKPAAFRLDDARVRMSAEEDLQPTLSGEARIVPTREGEIAGLPAPERKRGIRWGRWFAAGLGGLASLAIGLSIDALIRDLFARNDWLGWLGIGLATLAALGALGLIFREIFGILRLRHIEDLRKTFAVAAETDDQDKARAGIRELVALYGERPETARGRNALSGHMREIIDGRDLIVLAERDLLKELDARAVRIVKDSVKRVSVVTAVSPRAALDLAVVLIENLRIMRRLATLYGGRPGLIGFFRLARHVAAHLAMTGGMAAGDSLVSQLLGHGLAARLSARLGEGVVNGLLTARVGIAAIEVCRPVPFIGKRGPGVSDVMGELFRADPEAKALLEKAEGRPQDERS